MTMESKFVKDGIKENGKVIENVQHLARSHMSMFAAPQVRFVWISRTREGTYFVEIWLVLLCAHNSK